MYVFRGRRRVVGTGLCVFLLTCGLNEVALAATMPGFAVEVTGSGDDQSRSSPPRLAPPSEELGVALDTVPVVSLGSLEVGVLLAEDDATQQGSSEPPRIGVGRDLLLDLSAGHWYELEPERSEEPEGGDGEGEGDGEGDGEEEPPPPPPALWVAEVTSQDAVGLRLHLPAGALPSSARVAVYAPTTEGAKEVEIYQSGLYPDSGLWTGTVVGERARIEIHFPDGRPDPAAEPALVADGVQHIYRDPAADQGFSTLAALACHNDVTCHSAWANVAKSVARISYISGGSSKLCTGQLLNAQNDDLTPYFLTAAHCIDDNTEAQSAEFFWRYQTSSCGGTPPSLSSVPRSKVATHLSSGTAADHSLLMIEGALPSNLYWSGWTSSSVSDGTASTGIHHPQGEYKRISFGSKVAKTATCVLPATQLLQVNWSSGLTEPGSSGSGIFRDSDQRLYGQLSCANSSCTSQNVALYGSFASAYPNFSNLLQGGSDDNSEPNDSCSAARSLGSANLCCQVVKIWDEDWYRATVPFGQQITVRITFTHAHGDINAWMYRACNSGTISQSNSTGNEEVLTFRNLDPNTVLNGATVIWRVFLASDTRNSYRLEVSTAL